MVYSLSLIVAVVTVAAVVAAAAAVSALRRIRPRLMDGVILAVHVTS